MASPDPADIELLVLDVDGVLTDGRILLTPSGEEIKGFHSRDGAGMKYWRRVGRKLAIITGRGSPAVERRAAELDVDAVRLNVKNKLPALREVLEELGVSMERTAVMGDDLTDLPIMRECGFSAAPADAAAEILARADYVAGTPGGAGCVREVVELLLKRADLWRVILTRYIEESEEAGP